jgi:hypothetical protein
MLSLFAGCKHRSRPLAPTGGYGPAELLATARTSLEPDVDQLPAPPDTPDMELVAPTQYRLLDASMVQERAVQNAPTAGLLEGERGKQRHPLSDCLHPGRARRDKLKQAVIGYSSLEIRNQSAAIALESFFHLAEAEAKADLLQSTVRDLGETVSQIKQLKEQGVKTPGEAEKLSNQATDTEGDQIRLRSAIDRLNVELRRIAALGNARVEFLWPSTDYSVDATPIDTERAVDVGLVYRAELNLIRTLLTDLDDATLPVVREGMKTIHGGLGQSDGHDAVRTVLAPLMLICKDKQSAEAQARKRQLRQHLSEREQAIAEEIRLTIRLLEAQVKLIDLTKKRVTASAAYAEVVNGKREAGVSTFVDLTLANIEWYKARADLVGSVMSWHRLMVRLKLAQGVLPFEAGVGLPCPQP